MSILFSNTKYKNDQINKSVQHILESVELCSIATISENGTSHINTAFFCFTENLEIIFLSHPHSEHCQNIMQNSSVAVNVFDTKQKWGGDLLGLQIFGTCEPVQSGKKDWAFQVYCKRFPSYLKVFASSLIGYKFYIINPAYLKITDEISFHDEEYVKVYVTKK